MKREIIGQVVVGGKALPIAKANRAGGFLFLSGQLPLGADGQVVSGGIEVQTRQALENLKAVLAACGATLDDVVKITVWITDRAHFAGFNQVYAEYFATNPPPRSTAVCDLVVDALIEIEAIAAA